MKNSGNLKYIVLVCSIGFAMHSTAMDKKSIPKSTQIESLQTLSAEKVVTRLASLIKQEIQCNNNNNQSAMPENLPQFVAVYVPEAVASFPLIWKQLFIQLIYDQTIPALDKAALLKNHLKLQGSSPNRDNKAQDNNAEVTQELFDSFQLLRQEDILDFMVQQFVQTQGKDAVSLHNLIITTLQLQDKESWEVEFFLAVLHRLLYTPATYYSMEQKYAFVQSLLKSSMELGLNNTQVHDFLYDIAPLIRDYALSTLDVESSAFVIVHKVEHDATEFAKIAGFDLATKHTLMANIFCALMVSDRFAMDKKMHIINEIMASFGRVLVIRQAKVLFDFINKFKQGPRDILSVQSVIKTYPVGSTTTLLHLATLQINNNSNIMKQLIQLGAPVNAVDSFGKTPLFNALAMGSRDATKLLLKNGARVDVQDNDNQTPLHLFFSKLDQIVLMDDAVEDIIYALLNYQPPLNLKDSNGNTPLALWRKVTEISGTFKQKIDKLLTERGATE